MNVSLLTPDGHDSRDHSTVPGVVGGGGLASGTTFPGSPSTDDLFYRTDRDLLYYYDGTRWLTVNLYSQPLGNVANISATTDHWNPVWTDDYDMWVVDWRLSMNASGLSGSAYWIADLYYPDAAALGSIVATANMSADASNATVKKKVAVGALVGTGKDGVLVEYRKQGSPGGLWAGSMLTYRLAG